MDTAVPIARRLGGRFDERYPFVARSVAAALAVGLSVFVALTEAPENRPLIALQRAVMVGVPLGVGLYTWHRRPHERFGPLLVAAGAGGFLTIFGESSDELLYSVGRTAGWLLEVLLVYTLLAFPTGRLPGRPDRLLAAGAALAVMTLMLPRLVLDAEFDVPSPYTSCTSDCPRNAFFLLGREPAFVDAILRPVGVLIVITVMVAVLVRLGRRMRAATPAARRTLSPLLAVGSARVALLAVALLGRQIDSGALVVEAAAVLLGFGIPAIAVASLAGLLRGRLFADRALRRLAACVRALPDTAALRRALARAFDDPMVEIVVPATEAGEPWIDSSGRPARLPEPGSGRELSEVRDGGLLVAGLIHDEGLVARPELIEAGTAIAGVVLANQRLASQAEASARALRESRARIAASAERERRRIERDLHDGAQQRLVALRIELGLVEDLVLSGNPTEPLHACGSSSTTSTRRSSSCGRSRTVCIRRCSRIAGWSTLCGPPRRARRSRSQSRPMTSVATGPTSRAPCTSA